MACNHGNEYQIKCIHENGTEELAAWITNEELLAQAIAALRWAPGKSYWVRKRNVVCPECLDVEQLIIMECPITGIPSPRYRPHDSRYLLAAGSRCRYEVLSRTEQTFRRGRRECVRTGHGASMTRAK